MSDTPIEDCCANCGEKPGDTAKLKACTACRLVKYCGVDCQRAHRKQHKKACKERAAELKDERLYNQGHERPEEDFCPICTLPIPIPMYENACFTVCCMKRVCHGCTWAKIMRGMSDCCAFCRTPSAKDQASGLAQAQVRVAAKDPDAIQFLADQYNHGDSGLEKDEPRAIELWTEAAKLGSLDACYNLGNTYLHGEAVTQDLAKAAHYFEVAACRGHVQSRRSLGVLECNNGECVRAVRHFTISAKMGCADSVEDIKYMYTEGEATRAQYADALKLCQDAMEEMKSTQREQAVYLRSRFR